MPNSQTKNVLTEIVAHKVQELVVRKQQRAQEQLESAAQILAPGARLEAAFHQSRFNVRCILEIKPSSPSAGVLAETFDLPAILEKYQQYGVAISVLTDRKYFGGSLDLFNNVAQAVNIPVLCKDFIIDPYQVYEARCAGAQAVLLIVKALSDEQLSALMSVTLKLGMTPLVEIQDETELNRALKVEPTILLINNRNLQSLAIDLATTERLSPKIPEGILKISASGIENRHDIDRLKPFCDGFLIGSLLMRQPSPVALQQTLQELIL
jgi:indole-3-glycerol phosphate synthase / phosphoribosylanthranilate isomerase